MLVTRCDLNGMQWHLVGFQPTRFLQKQRNADPVEPLKDFSGTKMMAVLKRSPKMVSWIEPCQTLTTSSQWSHAAVGKWRIWSFNANAKRSVKSNGFQLRPTLKLCFLGLHSLKCNEWDMFDARDVRSLKQVASVVAKPGTTKSFLQDAFPSPLCTLEPGWNYGPFTRCWLFVQKARLQSGGFQRPSWWKARAKNHKTGPVGGSWWWLLSNKTHLSWHGLRKVNGRVGKKLVSDSLCWNFQKRNFWDEMMKVSLWLPNLLIPSEVLEDWNWIPS